MSTYYNSAYIPNKDNYIQDNKGNLKVSKTFDTPVFDGYFSSKSDTIPYFSFSNLDYDFKYDFTKQPDDVSDIVKAQKVSITVPQIGEEKNPFGDKTKSLLYEASHKTNLLKVAQNHLGYQEVSASEYSKLSADERAKTQMHFIGNHGNINHEWCAHAISHLSEEAGMNIGGHKIQVQQFINWATNKGYYRPIKTNKATESNYLWERKQREAQIKKQFGEMQEGDFIIWKSSYVAELPNGEFKQKNSSHIGILESVNEDGTITVIEGNANEFLTGENFERELVKNSKDATMGAQYIGDFKEVNKRDGLIRKTYTAENLASFGYAGYIDTQEIIK